MQGAALLTHLFVCGKEAETEAAVMPILRFLFARSAQPYLSMLDAWIYRGELVDPHGEFMVGTLPTAADPLAALPPAAATADARSWGLRDEATVPVFLRGARQEILECGALAQPELAHRVDTPSLAQAWCWRYCGTRRPRTTSAWWSLPTPCCGRMAARPRGSASLCRAWRSLRRFAHGRAGARVRLAAHMWVRAQTRNTVRLEQLAALSALEAEEERAAQEEKQAAAAASAGQRLRQVRARHRWPSRRIHPRRAARRT